MSAEPRRAWLVLGLLCGAQLLVVLDATIVNIALPSIQTDLGFSDTNLQWVVNAYVLTFGGLLLLGGRSADIFARRDVFLAGVMLFVAASLGSGLAGSQGMLIGARATQGVGAALMSAAALSILMVTFRTAKERHVALGAWGATSGLAGALGVILGGALTSGPGWEWVFFINVPLGLAVTVLGLRFIARERTRDHPPHDALGALAVTAGLGLLIFAIVRAQQEGWGSSQTLGCAAGAFAILAAFLVIESTHRAPLVPLDVFRHRNLSAGNTVILLLGAVVLVIFFFATLYMQRVLGYSPIQSGLAYLPMATLLIVSSTVTSRLMGLVPLKLLLAVGMATQAIGLAWFAQVNAHGTYLANILPASLVTAVGLGIAFVVAVAVATDDVRDAGESGLVSGLANTSQQVGGALGLAVVSTVAFEHVESLAAGGTAMTQALTGGFRLAFWIGAMIAAAGTLVALLFLDLGQEERGGESRAVTADALKGP